MRKLFSSYKNDILLILGLCLLCGLLFSLRLFNRKAGVSVTVEQEGKVLAVYNLQEEREERFLTGDGPEEYNVLVIQDGQAYVKEASCPDQICVHHKKIRNEGESIVCLPHKFVITISQDDTLAETDR